MNDENPISTSFKSELINFLKDIWDYLRQSFMENSVIYIVVGTAVIIIILLCCCCCCCCKKKNRSRSNESRSSVARKTSVPSISGPVELSSEFQRDNEVFKKELEENFSISIDIPMETIVVEPVSENNVASIHIPLEENITEKISDSSQNGNTIEEVVDEMILVANELAKTPSNDTHSNFDRNSVNKSPINNPDEPDISQTTEVKETSDQDDWIVKYDPETGNYSLNTKNYSAPNTLERKKKKQRPHSNIISDFHRSESPKIVPYYYENGNTVEPFDGQGNTRINATRVSNRVLPINSNLQKYANRFSYGNDEPSLRPSTQNVPVHKTQDVNSKPVIPDPDYGTKKKKDPVEKPIIKERNFKGPYGLENLDDMNNPLTIADRERSKRISLQTYNDLSHHI